MNNLCSLPTALSSCLLGRKYRTRRQSRSESDRKKRLRMETLEKRQLLAAGIVAPESVELMTNGGPSDPYLEYGTSGSHWINGSGLSDASIVETGDPVPAVWPEHVAGNSDQRVSRIRGAAEESTLTFDLGGTFDLSGMVLWNSTEQAAGGTLQTDRGFENTRLSYSTDGGNTFSGNDLLTWTQRSADASANQGANPSSPVATFAPEAQMLPSTVQNVTHVRMVVDNFSGDGIVMASELRFLGQLDSSAPYQASLTAETVEGNYNLVQGIEGGRNIEFTVTLDKENATGSAISFDLDDLGTGNAISGIDYDAIPADAKIIVPAGSRTGSFTVNVIDDFLIEPTETMNVRISGSSYPSMTIDTATAMGTINDNDDAGVTLVGADNLQLSEAGDTDTYTIRLNTIPTGPVQITATADSELQVSTDGVTFGSSLDLNFTDMTPQTITVRAVNDQSIEGLHSGMISHAITGSVVDPNYPDVTPDDLYSVSGTDRTFQQLLDDGALRPGQNWSGGVQGSEVDVNNAVLEQGIPSNVSIPQNINAHTLNASVIRRNNFDNITRWYQEDGNTQVFRLFEGEENVRNDRGLAARIETFANASTAVWNDFSIRYTVLKAESVSLFQSKQNSEYDWGLHIGMTPEGDIHFTHRRNYDGGSRRFTLAEDMIGKSFEILVRDNGHEYELYFNGELIAENYYERPGRDFAWRWGPYRGARELNNDVLVFANNVQMRANTVAPVGLVPYRLPTTSLSIDSAIAQITDSEPVQEQFAPLTENTTVQNGTVIRAEEFDTGGQNVAYFDTTADNQGGSARADEDVDLYAGSIVLSNIADGEWLEFTRNVVPGVYDVDVRAWSTNDNAKGVRLFIAENASSSSFTELGYVSVPDTNNDRVSHTIENVDLTDWGGEDRVIRVAFEGGRFLYDWIKFNSKLDFGDAPESYGTLLADDGARHVAVGPQLGASRDSESDGGPTADADGDGSDDDGVMFGAIGAASSGAAVNVEVNLGDAEAAKVDAWIDFNRNGVFGDEAFEKILDSVSVADSMQTLNYKLPTGLESGDYFARVRVSVEGELGPTGPAPNGEVEDYVVSVMDSPEVESVVINGGDDQRSALDSVRVTFTGLVDVDTSHGSPFQFTPVDSSEVIPTQTPVIGQSGGKTTVDFKFVSGTTHVTGYGSLQDGHYALKIDASRVTSSGAWLKGGGGSGSSPYVDLNVDKFYRTYGDADGSGTVGLADFAIFRSAFGKSTTAPDFLGELDSDGDGTIGLADFAAFRTNFGR